MISSVRRAPAALLPALLAALLAPSVARAQVPTDTVRRPRVDTVQAPAPPPAAPSLPVDFSGVLYANYQYGGGKGNRTQNRFDVDRAYLTFRGAAGEHVSFRVTGDVFQQRDSTRDQFYRGWAYRIKYAYGQYDYIRGVGNELRAVARLGILHTPIIDYEEGFWPRGLAQVAIEQGGFMSSADGGAATLVTLPNKLGELYATVTNGTGYTSRETDRFKDYGGRLSLTPLASTHGILRTLSVTPWYSNGDRASDFVRGKGTVLPVSDARRKDRYGVFAGIRDPRAVLAAHWARRLDVVETADTLSQTVPTATDRTGEVISAYTILKPLAFMNAAPSWPVSLVFRWDRVKPNVDADAYARFLVAGLGFELSKRAQLYLDWQSQTPRNGSTAADTKTYFAHAIVSF